MWSSIYNDRWYGWNYHLFWFNSDSDSGPIFFMQDDMSTTDESDTDGDLNNMNMPNNQNQNVSKFSF